MIAEARAAFGLDGIGEASGPPPAEWSNVDCTSHLRAAADRLGLPAFVVNDARHSPELGAISTRLGRAIGYYRRAPRRGGIPVLLPGELHAVRAEIGCAASEGAVPLRVLADATEAMLREAYSAFGLELSAGPPPNMPQSRCCASHHQVGRKGNRPLAAWC